MNKKYYFTYGTEGQPFVGGWTEVEAPNADMACAAFRAVHPDKVPGSLNCSSAYTEEFFLRSCMATPDGNFRKFCHERITFSRLSRATRTSRLISAEACNEGRCRDNRFGGSRRRF